MKKIIDERIAKISNKLFAPWFYFLIVILLSLTVFKIFKGESLGVCIPELLTIFISASYYFIKMKNANLLFTSECDEYITDYKRKVTADSFKIALLTLLLLTGAVSMGLFSKSNYYSIYIYIIYLPAFVLIIQQFNKGLYLKENNPIQSSTRLSIINSFTSGFVFYWLRVYVSIRDYDLQLKEAMMRTENILYGLLFALFILFGHKFVHYFGEKKADKLVTQAEKRGS